MEVYLLKSGFCLAILFGFYKLFLENESMHIFKRFYLLGALVISLLIPLITFKTYVEMPLTTTPVLLNTHSFSVIEIEAHTNYWPFVLWGLYAMGVLYFSIKFGKNLNRLLSRIKNNHKLKQDAITHVLLRKRVIPHTFFNYVFLEKQKYEAQEIPDEVIQHEHIHAKQRHSIDILFVEVLQILFWFNPLLYFIKRSVKLNHEFLADRAVLKQGVDTTTYQKLLLAFSSTATTPTLANSINYSFIKKRFTVMNKQTSTKAIWLRSLLILPLLAILLYGFSTNEKIILEQEKNTITEELNSDIVTSINSNVSNKISDSIIIEQIQIHINSNEEFTLNGYYTNLNSINERLKTINPNLSKEDRKKLVIAHIYSDENTKMGLISDIKNELTKYGIYKFVSHQPVTKISKDFITTQEKATKAEVEEYNKLAKKYNNMSKNNIRINAEEVKRYSFLYHKMTLEQRKKAEPFPSVEGFPSAPPAPDEPKVGEETPVPPVPPVPISNIGKWEKDFNDLSQSKKIASTYSIVFQINDEESFSINNKSASLENYKIILKSILNEPKFKDNTENIVAHLNSENPIKISFIMKIGEELRKNNVNKIYISESIIDDRNK
jgi:bla regulator protein BlaR1